MVLNIDGSRNRRLGLDYEDGNIGVAAPNPNINITDIEINTFRWDNAGGISGKSILVVQFANRVNFFNLNPGQAISANYFWTFDFFSTTPNSKFSFAVVDGVLVIVNGDKNIYLIESTGPQELRMTTKRIMIRDLFGVEDIWIDDADATRGNGVLIRPAELTDGHLYNLRNQGWGIPRLNGNTEDSMDPVEAFFTTVNGYPSNGDTVVESLYADPADTDNRTVERFFPLNLYHNPIGTARAAQGYYVIDALDRGASRKQVDEQNFGRFENLTYEVGSLSEDSTPGGATAVCEYAGRMWYGGFSGDVVNGDSHSPKLSSYVMFSRVVDNISDINLCYQEGDPTSKYNADLVDTDGGFIRFNEAHGIHRLISLGSSLFVIAANGIWRVHGGSDNGFTATTFIVERITDRGCNSPNSIVRVDNTFMYWADDSIYHVGPDQFGSWRAENISYGRIQRLYNTIPTASKEDVIGEFDSYEKKVRWIWNNKSNNDNQTRELVLDIQLNAYSTNTFPKLSGQQFPKVVAMYKGLPYKSDSGLSGSDYKYQEVNTISKELGYLIIMHTDGAGSSYAFATYRNKNFRDYYSMNGVGEDAAAFMITSYLAGGDFQRDKQVEYIQTHLKRTELGYNSDMTPINETSCLVQARWGWSNNDSSGKWGREFQAYRYRNQYPPVNSSSPINNGFDVITTKSKLRGTGRVLSLRFRTEPDKDFHMYGWSLVISIEEKP